MSPVAGSSLNATTTITTTEADVLECPPGWDAEITQIYCHNLVSSVQTIELFYEKNGGTAVKIGQMQLGLKETGDFKAAEEPLRMQGTDKIRMKTTSNSAVNVLVNGYVTVPSQRGFAP